MTWTAVGSYYDLSGIGQGTFTISPVNVGDLILVEILVADATVHCTGITGGNCTWVQIGTTVTTTGDVRTCTVFGGTATGTGSATATPTYSGTPSGGTTRAGAQEFHSTAGAWALDVQGTLQGSGSALPSLTPAGAGELYFIYLHDSGNATAGSTPGYTYDIDGVGNAAVFNPACTSSVQSPNIGDSGDTHSGIAILMKETGAPVTVAPVYPLARPARAPVPVAFSKGRGSGSKGAPVANPVAGPAFRQATQPFRSRIRVTFSRGRAEALRGAPPANPVSGPAVRPLSSPVRARRPLFLLGRAEARPGAPVANPVRGPALRPLSAPARAAQPQPPRGRAAGSRGAPVQNPSNNAGPPFYALRQAVHIRFALPPRGRIISGKGNPVANPVAGPVFRQFTAPLRARIAQVFSRGRITSSPGSPVQNPAPPSGPVFRPATQPCRARIPQPFSRGRFSASGGAPVRNPVPAGPAPLYPLGKALHSRPPVFLKGRIISSPGAPVRNPGRGPQPRPLSGPVRGQPAFPVRYGRAAGSGGAPVTFPPIPPSTVAGLLSITPAGRQAAVLSIRLATAATTDISHLGSPLRPARIRPPAVVTLYPPGPLRT